MAKLSSACRNFKQALHIKYAWIATPLAANSMSWPFPFRGHRCTEGVLLMPLKYNYAATIAVI